MPHPRKHEREGKRLLRFSKQPTRCAVAWLGINSKCAFLIELIKGKMGEKRKKLKKVHTPTLKK